MNYQGDFLEDATVYIPFNTFDSNDPSASVTITDLAQGDVEIWKDGVVQATPGSGVTLTLNIGTNNGTHLIAVDTSDVTDAGFYVINADYQVRINGTTIDAATVNAWVGTFSIENRFTEVDLVSINGIATQLQMLMDASTTINADADLTGVVVDKSVLSHVMTPAADTSTYRASTDSQEAIGIDTDAIIVGTVTNAQGADVATDVALLVGTDGKALISTDAQDLSGTLDVNTKTITANAITATAINADAITAAKIADDAIAAEHLATGAIVAATFAANAITSTVVADNTITAAKINADAITAAKIADDAIAAEHLATGAIVAATFAANAITSTVVADNTITAAKLNADCITEAKIADDAIAAEHLATGAIAADAVAATALDNVVMSDLATGAPSATASLPVALNWIYESFRNKTETTATRITIYKDDGATELARSTISDDATTFTKSEIVTGV